MRSSTQGRIQRFKKVAHGSDLDKYKGSARMTALIENDTRLPTRRWLPVSSCIAPPNPRPKSWPTLSWQDQARTGDRQRSFPFFGSVMKATQGPVGRKRAGDRDEAYGSKP